MSSSPEPQASTGTFTPGPWHVGKPYGSGHIPIVEGDTPGALAMTLRPGAEADAHLIAAAPDLYAALAEIMAEGAVVRDDLVDAAHAALAKARGES